MDLLLDTDIAVDLCTRREPFHDDARRAVARCQEAGARIWLYVGGVQLLAQSTRDELNRQSSTNGQLGSQVTEPAMNQLLNRFASDKSWLSALASEGPVFDSEWPAGEQMIRSMKRFLPGRMKLLTRNPHLLEAYPNESVTARQYLQLEIQSVPVDFVDLASQQDAIRAQLETNIHRVLHHGQYIMGPEVLELESRLASYVGSKHCITASSGTDTLLMAMMALGVAPGDEVITTVFTFIATAEMIALLGATPVFVDIDPRTYNLDPAQLAAAIGPRTKAIIAVNLFGQCADFDKINAIASEYGVSVIEDAAQSFGATYKGKRSCSLSSIGSASFFPSKPLGCYGDGGALFTDDDLLAKRMREIRVHGQDRRYHHPVLGINGRMDSLQAAILLAKLDRFVDFEVAARESIGSRYTQLLGNSRSLGAAAQSGVLVAPHIEPFNTSVFAQYTLRAQDREGLAKHLNSRGIPTAIHYPIPLHLQPVFSRPGIGEGSFPAAESAAKQVISLPMSADLTEVVQLRITHILESFVDGKS